MRFVFVSIHERPAQHIMLQGIHMHFATHIRKEFLQYVCVGILHIQLDIYREKNLLWQQLNVTLDGKLGP